MIALANQVAVGGLRGWTWSPARQDAAEGVLVPFPMRESLSWPLAVGALNLIAQAFALVVALFSLLYGRDVFSHSPLLVAVLEPAGLVLILWSAVLARHDPELKRIQEHVTQVETPPGRPGLTS